MAGREYILDEVHISSNIDTTGGPERSFVIKKVALFAMRASCSLYCFSLREAAVFRSFSPKNTSKRYASKWLYLFTLLSDSPVVKYIPYSRRGIKATTCPLIIRKTFLRD